MGNFKVLDTVPTTVLYNLTQYHFRSCLHSAPKPYSSLRPQLAPTFFFYLWLRLPSHSGFSSFRLRKLLFCSLVMDCLPFLNSRDFCQSKFWVTGTSITHSAQNLKQKNEAKESHEKKLTCVLRDNVWGENFQDWRTEGVKLMPASFLPFVWSEMLKTNRLLLNSKVVLLNGDWVPSKERW